jgi:nucleoside 2-deoxyribosyltransferase
MLDDGAANERFVEDPQVYLTRWIMNKVKDWPQGFYTAMGDTPLSRLHAAAGVLLRPEGLSKATAAEMESEADTIFGPLYELAVQLRDQHEKFVRSYAFLPIAAEVYARHSTVEPARGANTEPERLRHALRWLSDFARWFDRVGGADLPLPADPSILWTVFKRDFEKRAGQVFIAMSFRESRTLDGVREAFGEAIQQFNDTHPNSPLAPVRIDEQGGDSYDIPARVFHEIDESRLVIADLTDERQNVYCEVGYAKAKGIPFFLTFHRQAADTANTQTTAASNRVHFDLAPYRYIEYETTHELRDKLIQELNSWHDQA